MRVELHLNGIHEIILTPETDIERLVLATMSMNAEKGRAVSLTETVVGDKLSTVVIGVPA